MNELVEKNNFVQGLNILAKYCDTKINISAGFDIIYAGPQVIREDQISEIDQEILQSLGWHFEMDVDSWAYFT